MPAVAALCFLAIACLAMAQLAGLVTLAVACPLALTAFVGLMWAVYP
jgi:hypothetical protein